MRGDDQQTSHLFSYLSPEQRVPADHPLRAIRAMTDDALEGGCRRNRNALRHHGTSVGPARASAPVAGALVNWQFLFTAAVYDLLRLRNLHVCAG